MENVNETINSTKILELLNNLIPLISSHNMMYKGDHWLSFIQEHLEYDIKEKFEDEEIDWDWIEEDVTDEIFLTADTFLIYYSDQTEAFSHFGITQVQGMIDDHGVSSIASALFSLVENEGRELFSEIFHLLKLKITEYLNFECSECNGIFVYEATEYYREYEGSKMHSTTSINCLTCGREIA